MLAHDLGDDHLGLLLLVLGPLLGEELLDLVGGGLVLVGVVVAEDDLALDAWERSERRTGEEGGDEEEAVPARAKASSSETG